MAYEQEIVLSVDEELIVSKIRILIGDKKKIIHDYMSTCKSRLSDDERTIEMQDTGWPKSIYWNGIEETSSSGVVVEGYQYLTFSGTISDSDIIDMYQYTFRNSDITIKDAYAAAMIPSGLTSLTVTSDHLILQTSIDILEAGLWQDTIDAGARVREGDTTYDPSPGFSAREKAITRLRKRLDDLITQYLFSGQDGVLVD